MQGASARIRELMAGLRALAERERDEIGSVPKVMRRVGGYNLDVFHPQVERPYTADGGEPRPPAGRVRGHARLDSPAAPEARTAAAHRTLGVVSFPTLYSAMEARSTSSRSHRRRLNWSIAR